MTPPRSRWLPVVPPALLLAVLLALSGCTSTSQKPEQQLASSGEPAATHDAAPATVSPGSSYSLGHFPDTPAGKLPDATSQRLQAVLDDAVASTGPGVTATVMVAGRGTWTGAAGQADQAHAMAPAAKFYLGSVGKTMVAAEIMLLVQAGKLHLSDRVADHLPPGTHFDTNGTTLKDLLSMRSGIPDGVEPTVAELQAHPGRTWTPTQLLALIPKERDPRDQAFDYSNVPRQEVGRISVA